MLGPNMGQTYEKIIRERNGNKIDNNQLFDLILASHEDLYGEMQANRDRIIALEQRPGKFWRACGTKVGTILIAATAGSLAAILTKVIEYIT